MFTNRDDKPANKETNTNEEINANNEIIRLEDFLKNRSYSFITCFDQVKKMIDDKCPNPAFIVICSRCNMRIANIAEISNPYIFTLYTFEHRNCPAIGMRCKVPQCNRDHAEHECTNCKNKDANHLIINCNKRT